MHDELEGMGLERVEMQLCIEERDRFASILRGPGVWYLCRSNLEAAPLTDSRAGVYTSLFRLFQVFRFDELTHGKRSKP